MNSTYDLFLFAGQSNMAGRAGTNARFPQAAPPVIPNAGAEFRAVSDPTRLYPISEPFGYLENNPAGIYEPGAKTGSMVSSFVNAYYRTSGVPVLGLSASRGGSSVTEWLPGTPFFEDMAERLQGCLHFCAVNGLTLRHKYLLWCQGETDAKHSMSGNDYIRHFETMWKRLQELGIEHCFLVQIGHFNPYAVDLDTPLQDYTEIIAAQKSLPQKVPNVTMASTKFETMLYRGLMKDAYHYYQAAYNEVGADTGEIAGRF